MVSPTCCDSTGCSGCCSSAIRFTPCAHASSPKNWVWSLTSRQHAPARSEVVRRPARSSKKRQESRSAGSSGSSGCSRSPVRLFVPRARPMGNGVIGNTAVSGTVIQGSSPCSPAHGAYLRSLGWLLLAPLVVCFGCRAPSSSGLGHHPLKVAARVRIPLGLLTKPGHDVERAGITWSGAQVREHGHHPAVDSGDWLRPNLVKIRAVCVSTVRSL